MYKIILSIVIMCSGIGSYAQENINMINILDIEQDIVSLENRITGLIKKNPAIANIRGLRQFHIFLLGSYDTNELNFTNTSFLYQLTPDYYHLNSSFLFGRKPKYIRARTLITDSIGNLVATADARLVHVAPFYDQYHLDLAKMLFDKKLDFVCYLSSPHSLSYIVGIQGNNLYALKYTKEGLKIYPWKEFMDCCFDEWIHRSSR